MSIPFNVGSVTIKAKFAPVMDAMTGHPTPGDPSIKTLSYPFLFANSVASFRIKLTSFPEFSSAIPNSAWSIGPQRVSERNQRPLTAGSKSIAFASQKCMQTPHPSQAMGSTPNVIAARPFPGPLHEIASKRHNSSHLPHPVHGSD